MDDTISKSKVVSGLLWKLMERIGTQGIQFVVQIILARLLLPRDYGIIALVTVFIAVANMTVQSGFNTALIQKKDADGLDFSSVFYLSLLIAGLIYLIIYFSAPFIAAFYREQQLILILRVLSLTLFIGALTSIQNAIIARTMAFKKLFFSSLGAIILSGITGITMAYNGFGVWSLVAYQIVFQLTVSVILWFSVSWRLELKFSSARVGSLFSFGWKLLVSGILDTLYQNLYSLIIGKLYDSRMLGYYDRGNQMAAVIATNFNGSIQSVMFPALVSHQNDTVRLKSMARRSIVTCSFIIFPMMFGMLVVAEPLVKVLLTEKWLPCVPFLQLSCIIYALWPIHTVNLQVINALGRSDIFLKLEIIKKTLGLTVLGITIHYGIYAIIWGGVLVGMGSTFINAYPNKILINYGYIEQLKDMTPVFLLSLSMSVIVYSINFIDLDTLHKLIFQVAIGALSYLTLAKLFRVECYQYLLDTLKELIINKKGIHSMN